MGSWVLRLSRAGFCALRPDRRAFWSCRARVQAAQLAEEAHVVSQVLHPDLGFGPRQADRAHQRSAHIVCLCAEDVLDADPHAGFGPVAARGLFSQWIAAFTRAVDVASHFVGAQLRFHFLGPIGGIRPDARAGVAAH